MGLSLYEIDESIKRFVDVLYASADEDGVVPDEVIQELEELQEEQHYKWENIALYVKSLRAEALAIKEEEKRLADRRKSIESKSNNLERYLMTSMINAGEMKFETPRLKLSFRKSDEVNVIDMDKIPKKYINEIIDYKADKTELKKALKAGENIEGCVLVEKQNIQIK